MKCRICGCHIIEWGGILIHDPEERWEQTQRAPWIDHRAQPEEN